MAKVTADERKAIIATLQQTESIGETARRHKRAKSTISGIAAAEGLTVADRSATKHATAARAADNDARVEQLLERWAKRALTELDRVDALDGGAQFRLVKATGSGKVVDEMVTTAPEEDRQRMLTGAAIATDKVKVLRSLRSDAREGKTLIEQFVDGLAEAVAEAS